MKLDMKALTQDQRDFLDKVVGCTFSVKPTCKWEMNPDTGLVDVFDSVYIPDNFIKNGRLPVQFGKVTGFFRCSQNNLNTLEGCPYWVGEYFACSHNNLTSYKHAPKYIGENSYLFQNGYIQLIDWNPDYIGEGLHLDLNEINTEFHGVIIPEIEKMIENGIEIMNPERRYYPCREAYYQQKMINFL